MILKNELAVEVGFRLFTCRVTEKDIGVSVLNNPPLMQKNDLVPILFKHIYFLAYLGISFVMSIVFFLFFFLINIILNLVFNDLNYIQSILYTSSIIFLILPFFIMFFHFYMEQQYINLEEDYHLMNNLTIHSFVDFSISKNTYFFKKLLNVFIFMWLCNLLYLLN